MSLLLREKLAISSILPLQKGGSRTPSNSKYLLSNSIGVLGVSASLSAILETSCQRKKRKTRPPAWILRFSAFYRIKCEYGVDNRDGPLQVTSGCGDWSCVMHSPSRAGPVKRGRSDVMRAHESLHQDHSHRHKPRSSRGLLFSHHSRRLRGQALTNKNINEIKFTKFQFVYRFAYFARLQYLIPMLL